MKTATRSIRGPSKTHSVTGLQQPQDTVLALDSSGSMDDSDYPPSRMDAAKSSAQEYVDLRANLSPQDRVAVVSYASRAKRRCDLLPLHSNAQEVRKAIQQIKTGLYTAMGAGLLEAERKLLPGSTSQMFQWFRGQNSLHSVTALKRVVLLTDGWHNHGVDPQDISERLKHSGVQIDCIGIGGNPDEVDEKLLKELASVDQSTGIPRYRFIKDKAELMEHFRQLAMSITR